MEKKTQRRIMAAVVGTTVAMSGAAAMPAGGGGAAANREVLAANARSALADPILQTIDLVPAAESAPTRRGVAAPGAPQSTAAMSRAARGAPRAAAALARAESGAGARAVAPRTTGRFSLIGATWNDPRRALGAAVEIRTRRAADGAWTPWQRLESDEASPAEPGTGEARAARGSTDPLWVGESDGVQARVATATGRPGPLPAGLRVDLINPTGPTAQAPRIVPAAFALRAREDAVTLPPRPAPSVVSRAGWGANEAIVKGSPEYSSDVQVVFVHHTAGTNSYRCADSASIVRAIEAYHVKSNHWNDIGYNFLVDKCGTLFEGRRGGITRPVLGAHTLGFNTRSSAIAVLGNYSGRAVPARVKRVIAQVAAYKIGAYGSAPAGRVALVSSGSDRFAKGSTAMLNRISGHRDTGKTECPGNTLYAQLGSIRSLAGAGPGGLAVTKVNGAVKVGDTYYTRGTIRPFWQVGTPATMLHRFDVSVDDVLTASAARGGREQLLTLSPGLHTVRIRAVALNGRTASTTAAVLVDQDLPEFTSGPGLSLRTGSLNGIVPVRLRWSIADAGGLGSLDLTAPAPVRLDPTATTWAGSMGVGAETTYGLRATDRAGNARSVAVQNTAFIAAETLAERTGTWSELPGTAYLGATAVRGTAANSSLTWAFTGSSAALAVSRTAVSGRVRVIVDDQPAGIVDLRSPETLHRRAVWTRSWATSARHTVRIEVEGTAGRPGVIIDGLAYLR